MKYLRYLTLLGLVFLAIACSKDDDVIINGENHDDDEEQIEPDKSVKLPAKELRGVWVATVWGLDWPMGKHDANSQKELYLQYLDLLKECNMNAIFFQVRGMADSFYKSKYEPWNKNITGKIDGEPTYDIMNFLIEEAHKRDIQFHAWINPYRIATRAGIETDFTPLDKRIPKEWTKDYNKIRVYNPAIPEAQKRIKDIVKEIITQFDVDGIHIDDYFYPELESSEKMNDEEEFKKYGKGEFKSIEAFRRNNVNSIIQGLKEVIVNTKPEVIFSVSPAADMQHSYRDLYADTETWSKNGWIDVMIPQLYFPTGEKETSFNMRLNLWSQFTYKNHLMIGYGIYKFGNSQYGEVYQTTDDLVKQFEYASQKPKVNGSVLYSARDLMKNKIEIQNTIKKIYKKKVLLPYLGRDTENAPAQPSNLRFNGNVLSWKDVPNASKYAVYKNNGDDKEAEVMGICKESAFILNTKGVFFVTALSKENAESEPSIVIEYK